VGVSVRIANVLKEQGVISEKDIDICKYGLEIIFSSTIEVFSIFLIALLVGNFVHTFFFFLAFIPLRIYVGGYHASTKLRCYLVSLLVYVLFSTVEGVFPQTLYTMFNVLEIVFAMTMVIAFAPIIHFNKNVSVAEKKIYRKKSIKICFVQGLLILSMTLWFSNIAEITSFAMGQLAATVALLSAVIQEKVRKK